MLHSEDQSDKKTRSFIVHNALTILRSILRSRSAMKMNESFDIKSMTHYTIYFIERVKSILFFIIVTVLSQRHLNERREKNKMRRPENAFIGAGTKSQIVLKKSSSSPFVFLTPELKPYTNTCLPVAIILGFFFQISERYKYSKKSNFKYGYDMYKKLIFLKNNPKHNFALAHLKKIYSDLLNDLNMPLNGPFNINLIEKICCYFDTDCTVLSKAGNHIMYRFPKMPRSDKPHIYLLHTAAQNVGQNAHVDLILNENLYLKV